MVLAVTSIAIGSAFQHGWTLGVFYGSQGAILRWIGKCNISFFSEEIFRKEIHMSHFITYTQNHNYRNNINPFVNCDVQNYQFFKIWFISASMFFLGGMIGGLLVCPISSKIGRKNGLLLNNTFIFLGNGLLFCSKYTGNHHYFIAGCFLIGVNIGINSGIPLMFLIEISPVNLRGAIASMYQLVFTISNLFALTICATMVLGDEATWYVMGSLSILAGLFQLVTLPYCPESPMHLLLDKKEMEKAIRSLAWLRNMLDVYSEIDEIKSGRALVDTPNSFFKDMITDRSQRMRLTIVLLMVSAQSVIVINAHLLFSSPYVFLQNEIEELPPQSLTIVLSALNVGMTCVSILLIEKAGRKILLLSGLSIMIVSSIGLLICAITETLWSQHISIAFVVMFIISFAAGPSFIPFILANELFTQSARPIAISSSVVSYWLTHFCVGLIVLPLTARLGSYVFLLFFIFVQLWFLVLVLTSIPETKNRTIEEVNSTFKGN
jgi:SP family facilitated glucose transporter-like MFS transporter 1